MEIFDKIWQVLRFLIECLLVHGKTGWSRTARRNPDHGDYIWKWCYRVRQGTRETNVVVELASGRERMYIETLDAVYEDWNL